MITVKHLTRERLLGMTKAAGNERDLRQRRFTVFGLVRQLVTGAPDENLKLRLPCPPARVSEIFAAAYEGDATGAAYWANCLDYGEIEILPRLLAAHLAAEANEADDDSAVNLGEEAAEEIRVCRYGAKLMRCQELLREFPQGNFRERVKVIAGHRERVHLLPESLRNFLAQEATRAEAAIAGETPPKPLWRPWRLRLDQPRPVRAEFMRPNPYRPRPHDGEKARPPAPPGKTRQARPRRSDVPHVARVRGRKPAQFERVVKEMRDRIRKGADISTWTEAAMEAEFKASRDTCRRAYDALSVEK
jgi:hypothetical protein